MCARDRVYRKCVCWQVQRVFLIILRFPWQGIIQKLAKVLQLFLEPVLSGRGPVKLSVEWLFGGGTLKWSHWMWYWGMTLGSSISHVRDFFCWILFWHTLPWLYCQKFRYIVQNYISFGRWEQLLNKGGAHMMHCNWKCLQFRSAITVREQKVARYSHGVLICQIF